MYRLIFLFYCLNAASVSRKQQLLSDISKFTIQMVGYSPVQSDDYVAVSRQAPEGYIVGFEPFAHADRVHHMLLYGCAEPALTRTFWKGYMTCGPGVAHILYAWAKNAPNLILPNDVAFSVGHAKDGIRYLILQVHYAQPFAGDVRDFSGLTLYMSQKMPRNLAAVLLFVSGEPIPPGLRQVQINMSCEYNGDIELHPFAFRTHTHAMGRVVSAYYKHNGMWNKIGSRNPQWPQLFEMIPTTPVIRKGDLLAATCRFDSHDKTQPVPMGSMGTNEMCNFYMMFYWDSTNENPFPWGAICNGKERMNEVRYEYPKEGTELLPSNPDLEHHAHQSKVPFGVVEEGAFSSIGDVKLGQVVGLSFIHNNVIIFHRANRVWDINTFDQNNVLVDKTPIKEDVILITSIEGNRTRIVKKLGANKFYLPHGIHVDKQGFLYTTDVGAHTVAKWKISGEDLDLIWESGERLVPDNGPFHFCKPTAVVELNEDIFVSDGYCSNRVIQLDGATGRRKHEFGQPGDGPSQFNLPHDVVSMGAGGYLLVADRENGRVQKLSTRGDFIMKWASSLFTNIYSVDAHDEYIYMVPGRRDETGPIHVYVSRANVGFLEYSFGPTSRSFGQPHVIRVSPDGHRIFVGDVAKGKSTLWVLRVQHEGDSSALRDSSITHSSHVTSTKTGNTGILLSLAFAALVVGLAVLCRRQLTYVISRGQANFDRKGFKRLQTEETVGFISEESESE